MCIILIVINFFLFILGAIAGSFSYATYWRIRIFSKNTHSLLSDRSRCDNCNRQLSVIDLIPIISFVLTRGRCRYCNSKIALGNIVIEIIIGFLFVINYVFWPMQITGIYIFYFALWLLVITGFTILSLYDFRWKELPSVVIFTLYIIVVIGLVAYIISSDNYSFILSRILGFIFGGGIFYLLYQVSRGKWIGGGDVRLGGLIGLIVGGPINSLIMIFLASVLALLFIVSSIILKKPKLDKEVPFGPFLMLSCVIIVLFGGHISNLLHGIGI